MTDYEEAYDDFESYDDLEGYDDLEAFDDLEFVDERRRPRRRTRIRVPGGLRSATLHTPRGAARLNLPSAVPTLNQFRTLERAVSANSTRLASAAADLRRMRRMLAVRGRTDQGQDTSMLLFTLLSQRQLRDDLTGHTHTGSTAAAQLPAGSGTGGAFGSLLPLLLLQPGILGGSASRRGGGLGGISPLLFFLFFNS